MTDADTNEHPNAELSEDDSMPEHVTRTKTSKVNSARRWLKLLRFSLRTFLIVSLLASLSIVWYVKWREESIDESSLVVATQWDITTGKNVKWSLQLGSQTYCTPAVGDGKVFVGTNNGVGFVKRFPSSVDLGVLICINESDGKFLWQYSSPKLPTGRVHDWPQQGIPSTPLVEKKRLWIVTNRCEVVCLDTEGFHDGKNDGPFTSEFNQNRDEADVIWKFDMMAKLGVQPHNMTCCNPVSVGRRLFVGTCNGVDESHLNLKAAGAPSFICLDKVSGKLLWQDKSPGKNVLHGQWGSPVHAVLGGVSQVIFPAGDGWLYSFDPRGDGKGGSRVLWKFDCNPKKSKWVIGGRGTRNNLICAPRIYNELVYAVVGQDPEHGEGKGRIWCIDPTKRGDVSPDLVFNKSDPSTPIPHKRWQACEIEKGDFVKPNPNSALVWTFDSFDLNGNGKIEFEETFHRAISRVTIKNDIIVAVDFSGLVHCLSAKTGKHYWSYDTFAMCWSSPLIAGEHIYVADEDGDVAVFRLSADPNVAMVLGQPHQEIYMDSSVYSTPVAANNVLYITSRKTIFAIDDNGNKSVTAGPTRLPSP